jgi:D-serine deaminase-like pyridoxal phosphate-dependent protein
VTASSISLAEYLCGQGWDCIHIAFPFNIREIPRLNRLAAKQGISVQVVNAATAKALAEGLTEQVEFFVELDAGYGRTGIQSTDEAELEAIFKQASGSEFLKFKGFYIHPGHTYYGKDTDKIHLESQEALAKMKAKNKSSELSKLNALDKSSKTEQKSSTKTTKKKSSKPATTASDS